jgi:hypothetical protein
MEADRSIQILLTGVKAAHERMFQGKGTQKPEYPRDLAKLYSWSEDSFFELFNAVKDRKPEEIRKNAANVIILMSEIIEYAEKIGNPFAQKTKEA